MSDRFATQIIIGGIVDEQSLAGLIAAAVQDSAKSEWEGDPVGEQYFREAIAEARPVRFYDPEASGWQYENLERFCQEHALSFRRHRSAAHWFDAQFVCFAPGMNQPQTAAATQDSEEVLVPLSALRCAQNAGRSLDQVIADAQVALREIPPLRLRT